MWHNHKDMLTLYKDIKPQHMCIFIWYICNHKDILTLYKDFNQMLVTSNKKNAKQMHTVANHVAFNFGSTYNNNHVYCFMCCFSKMEHIAKAQKNQNTHSPLQNRTKTACYKTKNQNTHSPLQNKEPKHTQPVTKQSTQTHTAHYKTKNQNTHSPLQNKAPKHTAHYKTKHPNAHSPLQNKEPKHSQNKLVWECLCTHTHSQCDSLKKWKFNDDDIYICCITYNN